MFANTLINSASKILCIKNEKEQSLLANQNELTTKNNDKIEVLLEPSFNIEKNDFIPLSEDFKAFDKIFISCTDYYSEDTKFGLAQGCDFFALVGELGNVSLDDIKRYGIEDTSVSSGCVGMVFVN